MKEIGSYEAKTRFAQILRAVSKGKEFLITNHGKPIAKLVPVDQRSGRESAEIVQDLLEFQTECPCDDVRLEDLKNAISEGRR